MASAFRERGGKVTVYMDGAMGDAGADGVYAWKALTGWERLITVLGSGGGMWHLWGDAPFWWGWIRLRSRTAHTAFKERSSDKVSWRGYPSRLVPEDAREGEAVLVPAFGARVSGNAQSGAHRAGPGPLDAVRAAALTLRGMTVAGLPSPYLDALLGTDGYIRVREDTEEAWEEAVRLAGSEEGRKLAASARHAIKGQCSVDRCADSLIVLYRKVLGGKVE
ncbi:MAG: hypothetical protein IJU98_00765 [Synergistaceae bacterium]|nr:hypothetical protein [Synergistaceae bacterium]